MRLNNPTFASLFSTMREIIIENAQENNLKNVSLRIPHYRLIVVTGVSGSGKTSLVQDVLCAEGQRLFFEDPRLQGHERVRDIRNAGLETTDDVVRRAAFFDGLASRDAIVHQRRTKRIRRHLFEAEVGNRVGLVRRLAEILLGHRAGVIDILMPGFPRRRLLLAGYRLA